MAPLELPFYLKKLTVCAQGGGMFITGSSTVNMNSCQIYQHFAYYVSAALIMNLLGKFLHGPMEEVSMKLLICPT